jgi:nucleoside-diphosphate-sugar epimerase
VKKLTIVLIGGGFIAQHLLPALAKTEQYTLRVVTRSGRLNASNGCIIGDIKAFKADVREPESLLPALSEGCVVINLVYLREATESDNLTAVAALLSACKAAKVGRLVHLSTADVAGRVSTNNVTEATPCRPNNAYARCKLKVEELVHAAREFDTVILRPTAVFGADGKNLLKLSHDLIHASNWRCRAKAWLYGGRRMNLIHVDNVVAAIIFSATYPASFEGSVFIVSDDDNPENNYADVQAALAKGLGLGGKGHCARQAPPCLLSLLLRMTGKNNVRPMTTYDASKLKSLGFKRPQSLQAGLKDYLAWYRRKAGLVEDSR